VTNLRYGADIHIIDKVSAFFNNWVLKEKVGATKGAVSE